MVRLTSMLPSGCIDEIQIRQFVLVRGTAYGAKEYRVEQ